MKRIKMGLAAVAMAFGFASTATAGDPDGNFMIRLQGTGVFTQDHVKSLYTSTGADLRAAGFDASVSDVFIPTATLTYFLSKNWAVELFCCFSKHDVDLKPPAAAAALAGKVAESWIFPPALTLQYHVTGLGAFKPYIGAGAQYIAYFNEGRGRNTLNASSVSFSDSFGPTVQAGIDISLGGGWYLNADVKKSWLDTKATWHNSTVTGSNIIAKVDIDPLIVSAGIGYRFNLEDIFGHRGGHEPLK